MNRYIVLLSIVACSIMVGAANAPIDTPDTGTNPTYQPRTCGGFVAPEVYNRLLRKQRALTGHRPRARSKPVTRCAYNARKRIVKRARRDCFARLQQATASHYGRGDGFEGGPLACGGRLYAGQIGTAHKTLPCGTILYFRTSSGEGLRVPVIDRGPYIAGREFDLTSWTADHMSFDGVGTVFYSARNCWAK